METLLRIERLTEENFEAFASFIDCEDGGCYCSFWHQKFSSMEEWDRRKSEEPEKNKACMLDRVRSKFHLGVLAYEGDAPVAWISVGPVTDYYWTWRRVGQLGDASKTVAGIPCITRKTEVRGRLAEATLLRTLIPYAREQGWAAIEGYPFDREALDRHGDGLAWAGFPEDFAEAGFQRVGEHWLSSRDYPRSIWRMELS